MLFDPLGRYLFNTDNFHRFSYFLGTEAGELLRRFIEMIFYGIIIYMVISEYKRNKKREYKYLIVGFFSLFFRQLVMCSILFSRIFSVEKFTRFGIIVSLLDGYLESVALLLIVVAFIFPAFKEKTFIFQARIIKSLFLISLFTGISYILFKLDYLPVSYSSSILYLIQIIVLISPFYLLTRGEYKKIKYRKSILIAFLIYTLIPLTKMMNILLFGSLDPRLLVIQHPMPFLSILILMRSVYKGLVDKAFLKTKLKKSEEEVKHERELSKLKDQFISVVSHELRTPVTSMKLYLSLFLKGKFGKPTFMQKKAIDTLNDENNRLSDLVDDLLIINKIEAGKLVLQKSRFDLRVLIDDLYINIARSKGISVINRIRKDFSVYGDKSRIKQVFVNLMNNAIKFSENRGKIIISCGRRDGEWYLSIKDTGIGINQTEIPKLFDKFYQVDNVYTRKNQGIGLGLSIVKNIVEMHRGRVEVNSEVSKGTEFKVWFPEK